MRIFALRDALAIAFMLVLAAPSGCNKPSSSTTSSDDKGDDKSDKKKSKGDDDDDDDDDKSDKAKKKKKASDDDDDDSTSSKSKSKSKKTGDDDDDDKTPSPSHDDSDHAASGHDQALTTTTTTPAATTAKPPVGPTTGCAAGFSKPTFDSPCLKDCTNATGKQETCPAGYVCNAYKTWTAPHCEKSNAPPTTTADAGVPNAAAIKCVAPSAPPCKAPYVLSPKGLCQIPCAGGSCASCNGNCQGGFCVPKSL